ncbi:hypothetical protein V6N11_024314 [Hibiscus sabdariffa]|uniref:Protein DETOXIFICATION n=1 Tax=Hibiscus sabdariffa TaxID=183260 RepID=A0ABR1ZP29_9ROSI
MAGPLNLESANGYSAEGGNGRCRKKVVDFAEAKVQILFAVPMVLCNVFYFSITLISVMFVGHLGDVRACCFNSCKFMGHCKFCESPLLFSQIGLSGALETLCGQNFGAKMYNMMGIYLQASCIISFLFSIIISIMWVFTEPILVLLNQDPEISRMAALYMKYLIPNLFAYSFLQNILRFVRTQSMVIPLVVFSVIPLGIHFGIAYSLVNKTSLGFKGATMATSISIWISFLSLAMYVVFAKRFKNTWKGWSFESFHYIIRNFKLALPSATMFCLESWAFEILVFLAGLMPNPEITTSLMTICVNTIDIAYMISYGLSAAASTRVSIELGAGNPNRAKHAATVTLKLSILVSLVVVLTLALGHDDKSKDSEQNRTEQIQRPNHCSIHVLATPSKMDRLLKAARSSGSLNLSNRSLRDVPEEIYRSLDSLGEDEKWWEAVELQKLILAHNNIESLKEDLRNLTLLTVLNVSHNKLTDLPAAVGQLSMLKSLDVSFNSIVAIPEEIGSATSLVKFDCANNRIKELPSSLGKCSDLSDLKASNNLITSLPEDLTNCSKLTKLDVEGNKLAALSENLFASSKNLLSSIPENIGCLSRLIRFDLHQNRISSIPPSIAGCSSLAEFYMGNNALSMVPDELGSLSRLGTLDLHSNQLKEYPVGACKLSLSVLDLSNNSLIGLPAELGKMTTLRKLLLSGNPLRTLRSSLVTGPTPALLRYLRSRLSEAEDSEAKSPAKEEVITMATRLSLTSKELSLEGMGLSAVPSEAWESGEILKLNLAKNSIQELPVELSSCLSLQTLILSRNNIKDWPVAILKSLPNLSCLKLDNNPLRQIPSDGFQAIPMLQILDISGNAGSLPENPAFSNLQHLKELYLRRMQLREVPSEIMSLPQLQILGLSQNSLQSIPEGLKNLTSLTELDLSDNNISSLPPELGLLEPSLQVLRLDGNPLRSIRRPILERGTKAVLKYLKDKIPEQ